MEFLRFIFSNFWVWLGFILLVYTIGGGVIELVKTCKRDRKVIAYRIGERWHITVENAAKEDKLLFPWRMTRMSRERMRIMGGSKKRERPAPNVLVGSFKISSRKMEPVLAKALTDAGYIVDVTPGIEFFGVSMAPMTYGSVITVFRKGAGQP